ncbi:hypothetical protein R1flu_029162 [Riccia fluitans]|uniref:CP-type G domain-containing protein n=1 Tax=Riccia fluitans TaxID=41844 RepID=A0ABD1XP95_9MARC
MVKKSKKSKSKRTPLRKKYKILKKVKEHHKKKAKEAKKLGNRKQKVEKDPGIPNAWPFREQELAALESRRSKALEEAEKRKQAKKERAAKRKLGIPDDEEMEDGEGDGLAKLKKDANERGEEFEQIKRAKVEETVNAPPENSRRSFFKEFQKVVEAADVVIQVLDARDPLGSRCLDVERMVLKSGATKRIILLLNKIDLVPREVAEKWLKYLREELPTVAFKCSTQQQRTNLGRKKPKHYKTKKEIPQTVLVSDCLGAENLLQLLKNYSRNQKLKTAITVGIVGFPNVGKSSLINSLKRTRVATVGATPGVTKVMQEVHLDKNVKLLDSPGIVFASSKDDEASATLRNVTKIEQLSDATTPVQEILKLCSKDKLMGIYKIPQFEGVDEFLQQVAIVSGKLRKGGVPNVLAAARVVLHDWNNGKIPYYTLPPERHVNTEHLEANIVSEWGKEFDISGLGVNEESVVMAGLPTLSSSLHSSELKPRAPLSMKVDDGTMDEDEEEDEEDDSD